MDRVVRAVTVEDLGESLAGFHGSAVGSCGHVAVDECVVEVGWRQWELAGKLVGEAALGGFGEGCGVVRDQAAEQVIGMLGIAEVPGAVERVEAGHCDGRCVADVVEPCGGGDQVSVFA